MKRIAKLHPNLAFPFLIGRIKSGMISHIDYADDTLFPFLIGRIKSFDLENEETLSEAFPFLIGRIKRSDFACRSIRKSNVSIPHR